MSSLQQASSCIEDFLLTTPAGQAVCLFQNALPRVRLKRNAKENLGLQSDLEHQTSVSTLTKEPTVVIGEQDFPDHHNDVSVNRSQTDTSLPELAENWSVAKRIYTSAIICLYTSVSSGPKIATEAH